MRTCENSSDLERGPGPRSIADEFSEVRMAVQKLQRCEIQLFTFTLHLLGPGVCVHVELCHRVFCVGTLIVGLDEPQRTSGPGPKQGFCTMEGRFFGPTARAATPVVAAPAMPRCGVSAQRQGDITSLPMVAEVDGAA